MNCLKKSILFILFNSILSAFSYAQPVDVNLPDSTRGEAGTRVMIPIEVGDLTNRNVVSYSTTLLFDSSILQVTGASSIGALSEIFGDPRVTIHDSLVIIAGNGLTPMIGSGVLVNVNFNVIGVPGQVSRLRFVNFRFNTGIPTVNLNDGSFIVDAPKEPEISIEPTSKDFGDVFVDSAAAQIFSIANAGTADLILTAASLTGDNSDQFNMSLNPPITVPPGLKQEILVTFTPTFAGMKNAVLEIASNDPDEPIARVMLAGNGLLATEPDIIIEPDKLDFGATVIGTSNVETLKIMNNGAGVLSVLSALLAGQDSDQFIVKSSPPPFTIAPNDSLFLLIGFVPKTDGMKDATLQIMSNDPDEPVLTATLKGEAINPLMLDIEIISPSAGRFICEDSVEVAGNVSVSGGLPPYVLSCEANGLMAQFLDENTFAVNVPLFVGENQLRLTCAVTDSLNAMETAENSVVILRTSTPFCSVEIIAPNDSTFTDADSVEVSAILSIYEGTPPFSIECNINGDTATMVGPTWKAFISLPEIENRIIASCTVTDSCGFETVCTDSILVFRTSSFCNIEIISPEDNALICKDSVNVSGQVAIAGGRPADIDCEINGLTFDLIGYEFKVMLPLEPGENTLIAGCTITDFSGTESTCRDSINILFDDTPPYCTFDIFEDHIAGTFFDEDSGMKDFVPINIRNGTLTVDPFTPGDREVNFRIDVVDPKKHISFSIDIFDLCDNAYNCDPIAANLSVDGLSNTLSFSFPKEDRYFEVNNHGLTEINLNLNGREFGLFSNAVRVENAPNSFFMPVDGKITLDLLSQLLQGNNHLELEFAGPSGSSAQILISADAHEIDYVLEFEMIPDAFILAQNYPNPFNPATTITFGIPAHQNQGVKVQLQIYNLRGELVRTLIQEQKFPGQHKIEWNGRNENHDPVSSGIYIYRLIAGDFVQTKRMVLLR